MESRETTLALGMTTIGLEVARWVSLYLTEAATLKLPGTFERILKSKLLSKLFGALKS